MWNNKINLESEIYAVGKYVESYSRNVSLACVYIQSLFVPISFVAQTTLPFQVNVSSGKLTDRPVSNGLKTLTACERN
jgi:hypothetical protein